MDNVNNQLQCLCSLSSCGFREVVGFNDAIGSEIVLNHAEVALSCIPSAAAHTVGMDEDIILLF